MNPNAKSTAFETRNDRFLNFVKRATQLHGDLFDYSQGEYVNAKTPMKIICRQHGLFYQPPDQHIRTYNINKHKNVGGCPTCAQESRKRTKRKTLEQFFFEATKVHGNRYEYHLVEYVNTYTKVAITCRVHGVFKMTPKDHLVGKQGCRRCSDSAHYSGMALRWICQQEQKIGREIQHANNHGEFHIPGTKLHADRYDPETNTIYEFYGDKFHGNPRVYSSQEHCHPFDRRSTAEQLYDKLQKREQLLLSMEYNLITMWERDFVE